MDAYRDRALQVIGYTDEDDLEMMVKFSFANVVVQVSRKIDLVYGGGSIGLMGQVAHTVKSGGGHVVG